MSDSQTTVSVPAKLLDRIIGALAAATYPNNPDRDRDNAHNLWTELLALRSVEEASMQDDKAERALHELQEALQSRHLTDYVESRIRRAIILLRGESAP